MAESDAFHFVQHQGNLEVSLASVVNYRVIDTECDNLTFFVVFVDLSEAQSVSHQWDTNVTRSE